MTGIQLDAPSTSGPSAATLTAPGQSLVVGIVNVGEYQQKDYDTEELLTWADGSPMMGKVVTGLVVSADAGVTSGTDGPPLNPGDLCTFWCEKGRHYTWKDATKAHGKPVNVGDVMRWERIEDKPAKSAKHHPQKVYVAAIRRPETKDGDLADRCVAKYHELKDRPALDEAPPADPNAGTGYARASTEGF